MGISEGVSSDAHHANNTECKVTCMSIIDAMSLLRHDIYRHKEPPAEVMRCSFCRKRSAQVAGLFAGPDGVHICNECLKICEDILVDYEQHPEKPGKSLNAADEILRCSFCLKSQEEVNHLIAGPTVYICGDCAVRFREGIG